MLAPQSSLGALGSSRGRRLDRCESAIREVTAFLPGSLAPSGHRRSCVRHPMRSGPFRSGAETWQCCRWGVGFALLGKPLGCRHSPLEDLARTQSDGHALPHGHVRRCQVGATWELELLVRHLHRSSFRLGAGAACASRAGTGRRPREAPRRRVRSVAAEERPMVQRH